MPILLTILGIIIWNLGCELWDNHCQNVWYKQSLAKRNGEYMESKSSIFNGMDYGLSADVVKTNLDRIFLNEFK